MKYVTLTPAYGRDYKKKADVQADFDAGKDFVMVDLMQTTHCNKQDIEAMKPVQANIRYKNLQNIHSIIIK